jgi:cytochrome d ubiquinol oxidase subunit I
MVIGSYLTTAFVVGGIAAYYLHHNRHVKHARVMLGMAMIMAIFVTPIQAVLGDLHGLNTFKYQPAKVSAIEGIWNTERGAALKLFGWPDQAEEKTKYALEIPKLSSLILTHSLNGEVKGLKEWPKDDRPPAAWVFWSFRMMVGLGILMLFTGVTAGILFLRKQLFEKPWFQRWCMAMTPAGFLAVLAGWIVTEIGRQPYVVFGVIRTGKAVSPVIGSQLALSLFAFVFTYVFVFGAGSYYIVRLIGKGPADSETAYGTHGVKTPPIFKEPASEEGGKHV